MRKSNKSVGFVVRLIFVESAKKSCRSKRSKILRRT